ncbi:MAG: hypothetical protein JF609_05845, partial [Verrucomicrobia bacterium]|nr:hypothetical protein [Verrucomicrobiota bacterium]
MIGGNQFFFGGFPICFGSDLENHSTIHMNMYSQRASLIILALLLCQMCVRAEPISVIVIGTNAPPPRVQFGVDKITGAAKAVNLSVEYSGHRRVQVLVDVEPGLAGLNKEGFTLKSDQSGFTQIISKDDSGALYGCLELAKRIRETGKLPANLSFSDKPAMALRGTCVGMQKTF